MKNLPAIAMVLLLAAATASAVTLQEARNALGAGRTAEAADILSALHKAKPADVATLTWLARALWQDGRDVEAVAMWRKLLRVDRTNAEAKARLAAAATLAGDFAAALKRAEAMLDSGLAKEALAAVNALAGGYVPSAQAGALRYRTALALEATGDAKAAAKTAAEAAARAPAPLAAKARLLAARLHIRKLNDPQTGLTVLAALKLTGTDAGLAALLRGRALRMLSKPADALAAYGQARKLLAGEPELTQAVDGLIAVHLTLARPEMTAPGAKSKANANVEAAIKLAVEAVNAADADTQRQKAFATLSRVVATYDRALTIAAWEAAAKTLKLKSQVRRANVAAAANRLSLARETFDRESTVRNVVGKLADLGGPALDALDTLLTADATDEAAATAAKLYLDHARWLAGRQLGALAASVYVRFATRHGKAARAAEALLAAARLLREQGRIKAAELPKVEKLLADDAKALTHAWTLLKTWPTRREAGEAVGLVTEVAQFYTTRGARDVAVALYRDLLKNVPDAAEAAAARFNLAGLYLAKALAANRKLIQTGQKEKAKAVSADFKAALAELHTLLADADETRKPLRQKALAEVRKVARHFQSLSAWDIADSVLSAAAKAATEKAHQVAMALGRIDLRMAQGAAAIERLKAVSAKIPDGKLQPGDALVPQLVIDLVRTVAETDAAFNTALARLDTLTNRYAAEKLWRTALGVYVLKGAQVAPKSIQPRLGLRQAQLLKRRAMAELAVLLTTEFRPAKLPETEFIQATLAALSAVVKSHPGTPEAVAAVGEARSISSYYQGQTAFTVARKILDDFAKAHAKATFAETMRLDAIGVSLADARREFSKASALTGDAPPFAPFTPVLTEYKAFIGGSKDAVLIDSAYNRILSVPPLHVNRSMHKAAVAIYERFLKDFAAYDRADEIWYRIAVTHLQSVLGGSVEGKLSVRGDVQWKDSSAVFGTRGETSGWINDPSATPRLGDLPASRPAGEDVTSFADMRLAQAEQQWMRRVVGNRKIFERDIGGVGMPAKPDDDPVRKLNKAALVAARTALLKVLTDFPASILGTKCEKGIQVIVRYFADRKHWADSAETLDALAKALPEDGGTENVVFQAAEARTQEAVARSAVTERAKLAEFAARFDAARSAWDAFLKQFPKSDRKAVAQFRRAYTHYQQALGSQANHPDHATRSVLLGLTELEALRTAQPNEPAFARTAALTYDAAVLLSRKKRYTLAADVYRRFVVAHPVDPRAPEAALKVAHLLNNFVHDKRGAVVAYQAYLHSYNSVQRDKVIRLVFEIGKSFHARQEWTGAMMTFDLFLANYPTHTLAAEAALLRGDIFKANGEWESAIAAYESAKEEYASAAVKAEVAFRIGGCYENLSQWKKATEHFRKFLENHPRSKQTAAVRFRVHVLGDLARHQDVIDKYPNSNKRHWAQEKIAQRVENDLKNPDKAMVEYAKVVAKYPKTNEAAKSQFNIGKILFAQNRFADARAAFETFTVKFSGKSLEDDAWEMIGKTFEAEADREAKQTRAEKIEELRQFQEREMFQKNY